MSDNKENKNVKFSPEDKNLKMSHIEGNKQELTTIDTSAAVNTSQLKFSEHVATMTKEDVEKIEDRLFTWWSAANNKDVDIPPDDDTLSIGNRSINYKTFKKLVDEKILSETSNFDSALKFNFNKHSINAIANGLVKADESKKYDVGLYEFKHRENGVDLKKAKEELWPPISNMIESQKNNRDNAMHIIVNRNIYINPFIEALGYDEEEENARELRHINFSIVCGGRYFVFETSGGDSLLEYSASLPENEDISNKLKGNLFATASGIQSTTHDCNSIALGTIKNFVKSFTKDFGSDPKLFSEYLSLFFPEKDSPHPSFLFEEIVDTKKTERGTVVYTGMLPKEFFKYAQTVRGMNKVKEVIIEKLKETGIEDKKRKVLEKLREKIDSTIKKYVKAGVIKDSINFINTRAEFEKIKLLLDLGELENKGKLNKSALPTPKELAAKTANEKIEPEEAPNLNIGGNIKLAQDNSNLSGGRKTFREREKERRQKRKKSKRLE
ncbi:MAG: hypothetical protein LBP39_00540 [Rickettsiales bacterium]|jgi:hypothetical protein|nr:hypothetical protein [Rickettsiales bacterium]